MKIVINRCYGGFSLSPLAVKRLAELRGKPCYFFTHDLKTKTYTPIPLEQASSARFSWNAFLIPNPNEVLAEPKDWYSMTQEEREAQNAKYGMYDLESRPDDRADPLLIQVVEELGEKANGSCAELSIVEIPDGTDWEIDEYDGMERVEEKHRSWA